MTTKHDAKVQETLDYLYGLQQLGIKMNMEVPTQLMELLGNPHKGFRSIHITGTNGKGSTTAFIASILQQAGYKVGMYTSPHLLKFNERIRINGKQISDEDLIRWTDAIREKTEKEKLQPTFFEFTTALAFAYFAEQKIDIAVVEAGMGARLDATNVLKPDVAVITNVGFDHMQYLGNSIEKIAKEKAGIIKENSFLATAEKDGKMLKLFESICNEKGCKMLVVQKELEAKNISSGMECQTFELSGRIKGAFSIKLLGGHQITNASTALIAIELLKEKGWKIPDNSIKNGLEEAEWPGRLQIVSKKPLVIVDGAHNVAGMETLSRFMEKIPNRKTLVIAIAKDKEYKKMLRLIAPLFREVIATQGSFKPLDPGLIVAEARKYTANVKVIQNVAEAVKHAFGSAKEEDAILITGSLYMVGDALQFLKLQA